MQISNRNFSRLLRTLPNFLWPLKVILLKTSIKKHGKNFRLGPNVTIYNFKEFRVGDNVFIGDKTSIIGIVPVTIGDNVMFGPEVMIRGGDHNYSVVGVPIAEVKSGGINLPIVIENDVWVGARAIILKGVKICEGAIVGAGALVNKEVVPYSINVGFPSRPVKCRFSKENLKKHLTMMESNYSFESIAKIYEDMAIPFSSK